MINVNEIAQMNDDQARETTLHLLDKHSQQQRELREAQARNNEQEPTEAKLAKMKASATTTWLTMKAAMRKAGMLIGGTPLPGEQLDPTKGWYGKARASNATPSTPEGAPTDPATTAE